MTIDEALNVLIEEVNFTLLHVDLDPEHNAEVHTALKVVGTHQELLKRLSIDNLNIYHLHVLALAKAAKHSLELRDHTFRNIKDQESTEWFEIETRYISQTKDALKAIGSLNAIGSMSWYHHNVCQVFESIISDMTLKCREIKQAGAEILSQGCAETQNLLSTRYYKDIIDLFAPSQLVKAYLTDHH